MKKKTAFFVLVAIVVVSCISASARASLYLFNYSASVYSGDTGEIIVEFDVTANQISDEIGASKITIYRENGLMDSTKISHRETITMQKSPFLLKMEAARIQE